MIRRILSVFTSLMVFITAAAIQLVLLFSGVQWPDADEWLFGVVFIGLLLALGIGVGWMAIVVWIRR